MSSEISFYGYKCSKCEIQKQKQYFTCTNCNEKCCQNCFKKGSSQCMTTGHSILLENSPFSFWSEKNVRE